MSVDVAQLEEVTVDGWRALEQDDLGDWVLRASSGWTSRGNSVLTVGDPGLSLPQAVGVAQRWYAARSLPARFCLLTDAAGDPLHPALFTVLRDGGATTAQPTLTMTAPVGQLPQLTESSPPVTADAELTLPWLTAFAAYREVLPGVAEAIPTGSRAQLFLAVPGAEAGAQGHPGATPRAIAWMSIYPGWAGIHAMWVAPEHRRQGLATAIVAAVAQLGRDHHMGEVYLMVERDNQAAVTAYTAMGFAPHHGHLYATLPG